MKSYPLVLHVLQGIAPDAVAEFKFCPSRKWRADFAIPSHRLLVEIEGGVWSGGRHTRGSGFIGDMEKYNMAAILGYRVLRFQPKDATAKRITIIEGNVRAAMVLP